MLGALLGKDSGRHPNLWLSALAVGAWVLGLVAAALATTAATGQQRAISAAHRLLREQLEDALITETRVTRILHGPCPTMKRPSSRLRGDWTLAGIRRWWTGDEAIDGQREGRASDKTTGDQSEGRCSDKTTGGQCTGDKDRNRDAERKELREIGSIYAKRVKARWWLSVTMFVTGGVLALAAIVSGTPVSKPTRNTTAIPRAALTQLRHPCTTDHVSTTGLREYVMSGSRTLDDAAALSPLQPPARRYCFRPGRTRSRSRNAGQARRRRAPDS